MEKMRMESVDMTAQNVDKIGALFPNCVTETMSEDGKLRKAINFDMLRQMLSGDVVEGDEAYKPLKGECIAAAIHKILPSKGVPERMD